MIRFGPSGNCQAFYEAGYKESSQAPEWLEGMGLNAYEYSFALGKFLTDKTASKIREQAEKHGVEVSVHAPYYINFANTTETAIENNYRFLLASADGVKKLGGRHCVFHIGSQMKMERDEAFGNIKTVFTQFMKEYEKNAQGVFLCPETMGKYAQMGSVDEIFEICTWSNLLIPTLDFGHINCVMQGALRTKDNFKAILQKGIDKIGFEKMKDCHIHFSKIMYGEKGEIKHLTFEDDEYGPEPVPMLEAIYDLKLEPVIISESNGTQAGDAKIMRDLYFGLK